MISLERAIVEWNQTDVAYPSQLGLHQLFELQAQRAPDAAAILFSDERISYRTLDRRANQIAHHLRRQGVGVETLVGTCTRRSPDLVAAILGVLKAGGAFVPLDPEYPRERLALMIRETGLPTLVTDSACLLRVPFRGATLCLDEDAIRAESEERLAGGAGPENLAYVIFTSGSTGEPKGIAIRHTGALNNVVDLNTRFSVGAGDRVLAVSSLSFDMSVYEILGTLAAGATIVLPDHERAGDPGHLLSLIHRHQVTVWNSAPGLLGGFVAHLEARSGEVALPIRLVLLGGDWVPLDLSDRLRRFAPAAQVIVMGGATEASIHSTLFEVEQIDPAWKSVPYGRPMANQRTYVLDEQGRPTPIGEVGELYLGGIGLARGYWNRPDETADRFVPSPFQRGERIYRTGDRVRWRPDGTLELLGRADHQVKIRGFRVEPKEIEAELLRWPGVRQALVMAREDVRGDKRLVAYLLLADGSAWSPSQLRAHLADKLPPHLVPQAFVPLEKFPLSPNGKVDRACLPKPLWRRPLSEGERPATPAEQALASLWMELLRVDEVGRADDFVALGGHSLSLLQLASRIRARFEVELPLRALSCATLAQMAEAIGAQPRAATAAIPRAGEPAAYPLSLGQQRLLVLEQLRVSDGPCPYNEMFAFELEGPLDVDALVRSLHDVAARHTSWRSAFVLEHNQRVGRVLPEDRISVDKIDLSDLAAADQAQHWAALVRSESHRPFALEEGRAVRAFLIHRGRQRHTLVLSMHHLVMDGWSMSIFARELDALYRAGIAGSAAALPPLSIQYGDFAAWERAREAELVAAHLPYWKDQLQGAPPVLELATSHVRPPVFSFRGAHHRAPIGADTTRALAELARAEGINLSSALLAAYALLLGRHANQQDLVIGLVLSRRNRVELEPLLGFLVDTVPARIRWDDGATFRTILRTTQKIHQGAREHQECPLERIVGALGLTRDSSRNPLFQTMFAFQTAPEVSPTLGAASMKAGEIRLGLAKCDLTLGIEEREGALIADWEYASDLFDPQAIRGLASQFENLLERAVAAPDRAIVELPLLSEREHQELVALGTASAADYGRERSLCELFAEQVKARPEAVAVVDGERRATYAELDTRAGAVASRLRAMGVGPESCVGLYIDRSLELVVGVLGILKAGGAYVPIEMGCPAERMVFILKDCAAHALLTETKRSVELAGLGCPVVTVEGAGTGERVEPGVTGANLAYVIYTSGSTGQPKGVLVEHGMVSRLLASTAHWFGFGSEDVWPLFHSISFDFSVWEMWGALAHGARIVIVPREVTRSPQDVFELLAREKATVLCQTPPAFRGLSAVAIGRQRLESLRFLILGGESLDAESLRGWFAHYGDERPRVINLYGLTETSVFVTYRRMTARDLGRSGSFIGRRVPDVNLHVLDAAMAPVPAGVMGELWVGGPAVARGYLGRPELTAERFVPDPFGSGGRLYRTGDRVRRLGDGDLEYLGRADQQLKIRGYRIELGEIEVALLGHAGVAEAVVEAKGAADGGRRLVAYWVAKPGARPNAAELRQHLEDRLPPYMVPAAFVNLEKIPLGPGGKVDRRALPEPEAERPDLAALHRPPESAEEKALAEIWKAVLGVERADLDDNFFQLGGDSIRGLQLVNRSRGIGLELSVRTVFEHSTLAAMARMTRRLPSVREAATTEVAVEVPLTPIQQWFFERELPEAHHFNQSVMLRVGEGLSPALLEQALTVVVAQHGGLRMRYPRERDGWHQRQETTGRAGFEFVNLAEVATEARRRHLSEKVAALQAGLSLTEGPLVRAGYYDLGREGRRLLVVIHHLVVDIVSWQVLLDDLTRACEQLQAGRQIDLGERTTSFAVWSEKLRAHVASGALDGELDYWAKQPPGGSAIPTDGNTYDSAETLTLWLTDAETRQLLGEAQRAYRTRGPELLLAALAGALGEWTGRERVTIDLEGHGREELLPGMDLSRTIGWFTSLYPVELPVRAEDGEQIVAVKESLRAVPGNGIGYGLLRYLHPNVEVREQLVRPSAMVLFNYQGHRSTLPDKIFEWAEEETGPSASSKGLRSHALEINAQVVGGRLRVDFEFSDRLHRRATVGALAAAYHARLRALLAHCSSPGSGRHTPSDFPGMAIDQATIDKALAGHRLETMVPLSPVQEGMLLHSLLSKAYFVQAHWELRGVEPHRLRDAWQAVASRHEALRTWISRERPAAPVACVEEAVEIELEEQSWRNLSGDEEAHRFAQFLQKDRTRGFELDSRPPMRFIWIALDGGRAHFIWDFHHLLLDGWSMARVLSEVQEVYEARGAGRVPRLGEVAPPGAYRSWLERRDRAEEESFWRGKLAGFREPTSLLHHPTSAASKQRIVLSGALGAQLEALSARHSLTSSTWLQAAWAILLSRYTGSSDVVFGVTVSGRPPEVAGVESLVGLFINTLPLRIRLRESATAIELLQSVQAEQLELQPHAFAPLTEIQRWSDVPSARALFDSVVVFENYPIDVPPAEAPRLGMRTAHVHEETNYAWTLVAAPGKESLSVELSCRSDEDAARRLLGCFEQILRGIVEKPNRAIAELPLFGPTQQAEQRRLVELGQATKTGYGRERSLCELFAAQVKARPEAVAVVDGERRTTYAELDARAGAVASRLRAMGVGPESRIGLHIDRSLEMVAGVLGILQAGAAYVPIAMGCPRERMAFILKDCAAQALLTETGRAGELAGIGCPVVTLEGAQTQERVEAGVTGANLAYIIYTSGSTGEPKGVLIEHGMVSRLVGATAHWFELGPEDVWPLFHSISFDFSVWEMWGALAHGGRIVIVPREVARSPEDFYALLKREQATVLCQTPSAFRGFSAVAIERPPLESLRHVIFGGESLRPETLRGWFERYGDQRPRLVNMYGITETSVHTTYRRMAWADLETGRSAIGRAIPDVDLHVLGKQLEPVPVGMVGELYVGGPGVARGYVGRPDWTGERFLPDPYRQGARLYRSGDLARRLNDGEIEYLGRADQQVKIRGFRIELGEIEVALCRHAGVAEAVVEAKGTADGGKRLVAYWVAKSAARPTAADLRRHLEERMPSYMVPAAFVNLEKIPLLPSGKMDRGALPQPEGSRPEIAALYRPPETPAEKALAEIWKAVLGIDRVGLDDNFFELGGDSLLALLLLIGSRQAGLELTVRNLFEHPTVAELARLARPLSTNAAASSTGEARAMVPLTPLQEGMLFHALKGDRFYFNQLHWELRGQDRQRLQAAWQTVVTRHAALRTWISWRGPDRPVACVEEDVRIQFVRHDWRDLPPEEESQRFEELLLTDRSQRFELEGTPPMRFIWIALGDDRARFVWDFHHILLDGWSLARVLSEVLEVYRASLAERAPRLEPVVPYERYVSWLERQDRVKAESFWRGRLEGFREPTSLMARRPPARVVSGVKVQRLSLSRPAGTALKSVATRLHVTLNCVVAGAWAILLGRYCGADDVVFGVAVSGRSPEIGGVESMVGLLVNAVPLRVRIDARSTVANLLRQIQAEQVAVQEYAWASLADVQRYSGIPAGGSLFDSLVAYESHPIDPALREAPQLGLRGMAAYGETNYPISLEAVWHESLSLRLTYRPDEIDDASIQRLLGHLDTILSGIAAAPERAVSEVSLLHSEERVALLALGKAETTAYGRERSLCELFAAQVKARPEAVAVVDGERRATYAELDARAGAVASRLRAMGVGPESRVGLHIDRSLEMVVGVLGILKAGAAYVPIELGCPAERMAFILKDCAAQALLTETGRAGELAGIGCPVVTLEGAESQERVEAGVTGANLAYIIYTSGSTGEPKGVLIEHGMVSRLLASTAQSFGLGSEDVWPLFHSISFDVSVWEMWGALAHGGRIVIVPRETTQSPQDLFELLSLQRATVLCQTPSAFHGFSAVATAQQRLPSLRSLILTGESLDPESLRGWFAHHGDERPRVINLYGPTETSVFVTWRRMTMDDLGRSGSFIGRKFPDVDLHVLDAAMAPVPVGAVGELCVGGPAVARGYLGRPGWTAERFVPDPFGSGGRLYRTGDRARRLADGDLEFLGRADQQVKIRGYRIELGEIEVALSRHAKVAEAVVEARDGRRLIAYWVAKSAVRPTVAELRQHLGERLPRYMVPAAFVNLEKIPLLPSGKVDRRALPEPEGNRPDLETIYRPPESPEEKSLAEIWKAVLGVERVGLDDNFFELGGDSLLSVQLIRRCHRAGFALAVCDLFDHPTISALATIGAARRETAPVEPKPLPKRQDPHAYPLSKNQERILPARMHAGWFFPLEGVLDLAALEQSLRQVVARHSVLRASFPVMDGKPVQRISGEIELTIPYEDLRAPRPGRSVLEFFGEGVQSLDRSVAPPFRLMVARVGDARYIVHLVNDAIMGDGISLQIFLDELVQLYAGHVAGTPVELDAPRLEYADFAAWQQELYQGPAGEAQLQFWERYLEGAEALDLGSLPRERRGPRAWLNWDLPAACTNPFIRRTRKEGAPPAMGLLAALTLVLARKTRRTDLSIDVVSANRHREGTERMIGPFDQPMILRLRLPERPSFADALHAVRSQFAAVEPFLDVAPELFWPRNRVRFNYLRQLDFGLTHLRPWPWTPEEPVVPAPTQPFDLQASFVEHRDSCRIEAWFIYRPDRLDARTIGELRAELESVLEDAAKGAV